MNRTSTGKPYRILIAGLIQESVTFIEEETPLSQFRAVEASGPELVEQYRGTNTGIGGIIDVCNNEQAEIIPLFYSNGGAAGPTSDEAYMHYLDRLITGLKEAGDIDGVLLDLHGAMATPTRLDADREMLERLRSEVGPDVPIMVALDYHANLDSDSIAAANAVFGYHFSPHTDMGLTGERAAKCLFRTLRGEIDPVTVLVKPGVMVPSIFSATGMEPLKTIVDESIRVAEQSEVYLDVSVFAGFSYADVPNCGFSVVVVMDRDRAEAQRIAEEFSAKVWREREALNHRELVYSVDSGIEKAQALVSEGKRPVVLLEHADRMHDSTYVLRAVLEKKLPRVVVPYLWDPKAVEQAMRAGVGSKVTLEVGGHTSDRTGGAVTVTGNVLHAGPVTYRATGPYFTGRIVELGNVAVIDTGSAIVSVTTIPSTAIDDDCLKPFGLSLDQFDYVVLRSKTHFRAFFEPIAADILIIDTPDWGPADLHLLDYRHVPVSEVYPLNQKTSAG